MYVSGLDRGIIKNVYPYFSLVNQLKRQNTWRKIPSNSTVMDGLGWSSSNLVNEAQK